MGEDGDVASQGLRDGVARMGWGVGWGWGLKRDRQVHGRERNVVHLLYLILSGPWGVRHKTRREKERRAVRGKERVTKYVDERVPCSAVIKAARSLHYSTAIFVT